MLREELATKGKRRWIFLYFPRLVGFNKISYTLNLPLLEEADFSLSSP